MWRRRIRAVSFRGGLGRGAQPVQRLDTGDIGAGDLRGPAIDERTQIFDEQHAGLFPTGRYLDTSADSTPRFAAICAGSGYGRSAGSIAAASCSSPARSISRMRCTVAVTSVSATVHSST